MHQALSPSCNRTIVGLKVYGTEVVMETAGGCNRTIVGLKEVSASGVLKKEVVAIAP